MRVRGRPPRVARELVRAFSAWFQLVNVAEKVHRIRRRREYFQQDSDRPQPGGVEDALSRAEGRGPEPRGRAGTAGAAVDRTGAAGAPDGVHAPHDPAPPAAHGQRCCSTATTRMLAPHEQRTLLQRIRAEVSADWQTEEHPRERLTVADEREHAIFYLAEILYRIVPAFYQEIAAALGKLYGVLARDAGAAGDRALRHLGRRRHGVLGRRARQEHSRDAGARAAGHHQHYYDECQKLAQTLSQSAQPRRHIQRGDAPDGGIPHAAARRPGHHAVASRSHAVSGTARADRRAPARHLRRPLQRLPAAGAISRRRRTDRAEPAGQPRRARRLFPGAAAAVPHRYLRLPSGHARSARAHLGASRGAGAGPG